MVMYHHPDKSQSGRTAEKKKLPVPAEQGASDVSVKRESYFFIWAAIGSLALERIALTAGIAKRNAIQNIRADLGLGLDIVEIMLHRSTPSYLVVVSRGN